MSFGPTYGQPSYPPPTTGFPPVAAQPSGGTAITAAVLSFLGSFNMLLLTAFGLWRSVVVGIFAIGHWSGMGVSGFVLLVVTVLLTVCSAVACGLLAVGGTQALRRVVVARKLLMAGSGAALGWVILYVLGSVVGQFWYFHLFGMPLIVGIILTLLILPFAVATLVLAMVPSTTRWLEAGK